MTPAQFNEYQRQAEVIENHKKWLESQAKALPEGPSGQDIALPSSEQTKASVEKVKEYQDWLREIPELSDEEIKQGLFGGQFDDQDINDVSQFNAAKWYREQLKQRQ